MYVFSVAVVSRISNWFHVFASCLEAHPLAHAESLTQVYALLSSLLHRGDEPLQFAIYDNACALARFARHPGRRDRTQAAESLASLTYVLDSFHRANHTACLDEHHDFFLPEVQRERHPQLKDVNTQTAEQFFAWADTFVRSTSSMSPAVFEAFLLILVHFYNTAVCGQRSQRPRVHRAAPAPRPASAHARSQRGDAHQSDGAEPAPPPCWIHFRRNPHGVGFWGGGKFHWCRDSTAVRPPCNIVLLATLPESVRVAPHDVQFRADVGFILTKGGVQFQVCRTCALAARSAGLLPA